MQLCEEGAQLRIRQLQSMQQYELVEFVGVAQNRIEVRHSHD